MGYDIRMARLVSGESIIGKYNAEKQQIDDPAVLQTVQAQQGVQVMMLPFGYPFDNQYGGSISERHIVYYYQKCPEEMQTKYLEATSSLTLSSGGLGNVDLTKAPVGGLIRGK